jgi:cell pole-organizing protein PopZ
VAQPSGTARVVSAARPEAEKQATKETAASTSIAESEAPQGGFPVEAQFQVFKTAVRPLAAAARLAETPKAGAAGGESGAFLQGQLPEPLPEGGAPLVSAKTDATVASAFETLVASRFVQESEGFSEVIREMARPMLKAWLDDNLPIIVERLVRAEIERVARGGR